MLELEMVVMIVLKSLSISMGLTSDGELSRDMLLLLRITFELKPICFTSLLGDVEICAWNVTSLPVL